MRFIRFSNMEHSEILSYFREPIVSVPPNWR